MPKRTGIGRARDIKKVPCVVPGCESRGPGSDILCDSHRNALWPRDRCELIKAWRSGDVGRYQCELDNALALLTSGR